MQGKILSVLTRWSPPGTVDYFRDRLNHSPLAKRLASGAAWSLLGAVATRVLTLASSIIVVRILGKERLGEFGMVQSTLAMLGTFAGLGLGMTATKYVAELRTKDSARVGRILGIVIFSGLASGLVMTAAGWAASEWLAERVLERQSLAPYLRLSAILLVIGVVDGVLNSALAGFEAFGRTARISIYIAVVNLLISFPLVYWYGLYGAVVGLIIANSLHLVLAAIATVAACRSFGIHITLDRSAWQEWPMLVHYALPALAANIMVIPATWLVNVMLVRTDDGFASMGVIRVVDTLRNLVIYLPTVLLAPTFAVLSNVATDPESVRKILRYAIGTSALAVFPLGLMVAALAKYVLGTMFGEEFAAGGLTLALAMVVVAVQATGAALGHYISATGRMWLGLAINVLWAVMFVGMSFFLVPRWGPVGYMAAMAVAYAISVVLVYGGFAIKMPHLLQAYPLCRALAFFGVLVIPAVYANQNLALPAAAGTAVLLASTMATALAFPLARSTTGTLPPRSFETATHVPMTDE